MLIRLAGDIKEAYVAPDWRGGNSHHSETGLKFQHFEELDRAPLRRAEAGGLPLNAWVCLLLRMRLVSITGKPFNFWHRKAG